MNTLTLRVAVRRALLGLSAVTAGSLVQATGVAPEVMEEVIVSGRQRSAADDILNERIESEVVSDLISADQISRVGDSTVSTALRRLPGVTLVGDQFIYIRGLGERYSSTTVNGAYVPSPDLTRNVIPMDLFPSEIVGSLSIQKGYSADQPAAFGGGNVDIRTRTIPDDFEFNVQFGIGTNSESSDFEQDAVGQRVGHGEVGEVAGAVVAGRQVERRQLAGGDRAVLWLLVDVDLV